MRFANIKQWNAQLPDNLCMLHMKTSQTLRPVLTRKERRNRRPVHGTTQTNVLAAGREKGSMRSGDMTCLGNAVEGSDKLRDGLA